MGHRGAARQVIGVTLDHIMTFFMTLLNSNHDLLFRLVSNGVVLVGRFILLPFRFSGLARHTLLSTVSPHEQRIQWHPDRTDRRDAHNSRNCASRSECSVAASCRTHEQSRLHSTPAGDAVVPMKTEWTIK